MIKSVLQKTCKLLFVLLLVSVPLLSFKAAPDTLQLVAWSNDCLHRVFDASGDVKLKSWELTLTDDYFLRLRKIYQNGKQEYFSCHLGSFDDLDYLGTAASGLLKIKTRADDVIVQTYNDRAGDVDTMATALIIPVKNMQPDEVDSLRNAMLYLKTAQRLTGR